jgi:glutathione S-transferase
MLLAFIGGHLLLKELLPSKLNRGQHRYETYRWNSWLQSDFLDAVIEMIYETNPHLLLDEDRPLGV